MGGVFPRQRIEAVGKLFRRSAFQFACECGGIVTDPWRAARTPSVARCQPPLTTVSDAPSPPFDGGHQVTERAVDPVSTRSPKDRAPPAGNPRGDRFQLCQQHT